MANAQIVFVGTTSVSTANGGNATLTLPSSIMQPNDYVLVAYGTTRNLTPAVTSSAGTAYTAISSNVVSGTLNYQVFRRIMPAVVESQAICTGTGNANDSLAATAIILRGVNPYSPEDVTATTATGASTSPNSPSITVSNSNDTIVSCVGILVNSAPLTAPSTFVTSVSTGASDTRSCAAGLGWVVNTSTAAYDPPTWGSSTSAAWSAVTVAIESDPTGDSVTPTLWNSPPPSYRQLQYQAMAQCLSSATFVVPVETITLDKYDPNYPMSLNRRIIMIGA